MTDNEFEQIIIKTLYANPNVSGKIVPELTTDWFTNTDHKYIIDAIIDYNTKYSAMPNVIEVKRMLKDERTVNEFDNCMRIADADVNTPYIQEEIQEFIRKRLGSRVCMAYTEFCSTGKAKGSFADEMAYAESFTFDNKVGFSFFEEPEVIFNGIITNEKLYPTGCKSLDEMARGGLHEKSLTLFLAPTNIGKTLIMCSVTSSLILAGKKVLYISFEDSELKIGQRIMQNIFDITQFELHSLNKDSYKRLWLKKAAPLGHDKLVIKEYSEGVINALALKELIRELREKRGFVPDVLVIDYVKCMIPNGRLNPNENDNSKLRDICAQVRSIGMEMGIPVVSGAQANRGGYGKAEINLDDIADSYGSAMKADLIFGVTQPPDLKEANMYTVKLLKTRYGQPKSSVVTIGVDIEKQRIYDLKTFDKVPGETDPAAPSPSVARGKIEESDLNDFEL